jgi:hypothetical protein
LSSGYFDSFHNSGDYGNDTLAYNDQEVTSALETATAKALAMERELLQFQHKKAVQEREQRQTQRQPSASSSSPELLRKVSQVFETLLTPSKRDKPAGLQFSNDSRSAAPSMGSLTRSLFDSSSSTASSTASNGGGGSGSGTKTRPGTRGGGNNNSNVAIDRAAPWKHFYKEGMLTGNKDGMKLTRRHMVDYYTNAVNQPWKLDKNLSKIPGLISKYEVSHQRRVSCSQ